MNRRKFIKSGLVAGAATTIPSIFSIQHSWAKDVMYNGEIFDAKGAVLNIGEWGGGWEEFIRKVLVNDFEKDFNCKINWDSSFPWFPKFVTNGVKNPVFDICNFNLPELTKTNKTADFFTPLDEVKENVPNTKDTWDFAFKNGAGITWVYQPYVYAYRTDLAKPAPKSFRAFWENQYRDKRGTYVTSNGLYHTWFMATAKEFGKNQYDMEAAFKAIKEAMPMKISEFTFNMLTMLERSEVKIAVHIQGEALSLKNKGQPVDVYEWDSHPILTQTKAISRYSKPVQKKLAYAILNRTLEPKFLEKFGEEFLWRPTNRKARFAKLLRENGDKNTAKSAEAYWIPDWDFFVKNEQEIVDRTNEIFGL